MTDHDRFLHQQIRDAVHVYLFEKWPEVQKEMLSVIRELLAMNGNPDHIICIALHDESGNRLRVRVYHNGTINIKYQGQGRVIDVEF